MAASQLYLLANENAELSGGNSGGAGGQPPPTFRKSAQFVGNFRLCRNFKTIEYTEIDRKNYWPVRQLIIIERRFEYLVTICLICCVNHISYFCACLYLLKEPKTMKN